MLITCRYLQESMKIFCVGWSIAIDCGVRSVGYRWMWQRLLHAVLFCRRYHISLALAHMLHGEILVLSVRLKILLENLTIDKIFRRKNENGLTVSVRQFFCEYVLFFFFQKTHWQLNRYDTSYGVSPFGLICNDGIVLQCWLIIILFSVGTKARQVVQCYVQNYRLVFCLSRTR